jgi:oligoendopeptidase F
VRKSIELFREQNIPIQAELSVLQQQYGVISGKMTIEVDGKEYTLQQAAKFLENPDRKLRESVYRKINERRIADEAPLNELFQKLVSRRDQLGKNAGFGNYRDYKFKELGRFDYTKEDCYQFHQSVKEHILPLVNLVYKRKKEQLGLDSLRPWDLEAQPDGLQPLQPFKTGEELLEKTIACFTQLR